jgi:transcriptional antiterminator
VSIVLDDDEVLLKVFNNNIILVNSKEQEKILFEKGIGFGKKPGHIIEKGTIVEKIFTVEDEGNRQNLSNVIEKTDSEFFGICEEAILEISKRIKGKLNENIHIGLIDHLFYAVKRIKNNETIKNPFLVEIETLYKEECMLAQIIIDKIDEKLNVRMPDDEMAFVALHLHSAITNVGLSNTIRNSFLVNRIVEYVEQELLIKLDKKSLDYARFLTHIKFALQRILENRPTTNVLKDMIKEGYKESYRISKELGLIIEEELKLKVTEDEITFLAIHIERFRSTLKN